MYFRKKLDRIKKQEKEVCNMKELIEKQKLENAIQFYMLANNLKYKTKDHIQSLADQVYGSIILAIAMNSEYNLVEEHELAPVIRMISLGTINENYHEELCAILGKMNKGKLYNLDTHESQKPNEFRSKNGKFALHCTNTEYMLEYFFENFLVEQNIKSNNIEDLYHIAASHGIMDTIGNDPLKNYEIFRFYYLNRVLKKKIRSGWDKSHWNVSHDRIEKISEHVVGTIALAIGLDSEFEFGINIDEVISTLSIHEVGEIKIGDITPFDGITEEQKQEIEHQAIIDVIGNLTKNKEMINSIFNFDKKKEEGYKFAHYCDKLEADIQSKVYQDMGCHHELNDQEKNIVFKNQKAKKMVENGAKTAFDIWYEWDKPIYTDSKVFTKTLKYIKETKLK